MTDQKAQDQIDGITVINELNVDNLPAGTHQFWFRASTNALSQWHHLPVWVFKGEKSGKKVMITAAVHGDEYNGVLTAHQVARVLKKSNVEAGCVTLVPTLNIPGMLHHSRDFFSSDPDVSDGNLNRHFPGNSAGNEPQRFIHTIWQNLLVKNAELAIDLHTQTSGTTYPLYLFADFRLPDALKMARLMQPDAILNDPGEAGVLETVWNEQGIPSITAEIGIGRYTDIEMVEKATQGVLNILRHYCLIGNHNDAKSTEAKIIPATEPTPCAIETDKITSIRAQKGGFILPQVALLESVTKDQLLALQYNSFGELICEYKAPCDGIVLSHNVESMRAEGALVVRLIHP
jgi:predicted deacylase